MTEKTKYPSDEQEKALIRLPTGVRDKIKESAERNGRSMNAEYVAAIEFYLSRSDENERSGQRRIEQMLTAIMQKLGIKHGG